jgi:hypothetical protein
MGELQPGLHAPGQRGAAWRAAFRGLARAHHWCCRGEPLRELGAQGESRCAKLDRICAYGFPGDLCLWWLPPVLVVAAWHRHRGVEEESLHHHRRTPRPIRFCADSNSAPSGPR